MGSSKCITGDAFAVRPPENSQRHEQISIAESSIRPSDSNRRLHSSFSSKRSLARSTSRVLGFSSIPRRQNACQGDFCNYILKVSDALNNHDYDYDEILQKVRLMYSGSNNSEINKLKLSVAVDYLQQERDRTRPQHVDYQISNRYIILGRQFLQKHALNAGNDSKNLLELDAISLMQSNNLVQSLEESMIDVTSSRDPSLHPTRLYDSKRVCERCSNIYNILRIIIQKRRGGSSSSLPPIKNKSNSNSVLNRQSTRLVQAQSDYLVTPIGMINKNNLDDLLVDMRHAITQYNTTQSSSSLDHQIMKQHKRMTLSYKQKIEERKALEQLQSRETILPNKVDEDPFEKNLAAKFFPNEYVKLIQDKKTDGKQSWKELMKMVRTRKFARTRILYP